MPARAEVSVHARRQLRGPRASHRPSVGLFPSSDTGLTRPTSQGWCDPEPSSAEAFAHHPESTQKALNRDSSYYFKFKSSLLA